MNKKWLCALMLGLIACLPGIAGADLVTNGGFETGDFTGWSATFPSDCTDPYSFIPWTQYYKDGDTVWHTGTYGAWFGAYGGKGGYDTLTQTIDTVSGQSYTLDFWLKHAFGADGTDNFFKVYWNESPLLTNLNNQPFGPFGWTEYTYTVLATGASSTITFEGRESPGAYALDDVSVNAVPLPPSILLLVSGLLGLGMLGRRRSQTS